MKTHSKLCSSILALLGSIAISHAETVTWDGTTSGDAIWTDADSNSWSGGQYDNGDDAQFLGAGAGTVTLSGTITPNSVLVNSANNYDFTGVLSGGGSLTKDGTGILTLSSQNTYSGGTTVNNGTLNLDGGAKTLQQFGTLTVDGASSLVQLGPTVVANNIIDNMVVNIQNGGTVDDTTASGVVHSMQTTTFTNGGTLSSTGTGYNGTYGNYFFNGDIAVNGNAAATIDADAITLNGAGRLITVDDVTADANADLTISSIIKDWSNPSTINKNGAGTLVLSGANTYTGATNVNGGVLELNENDSNYSGGAININNGATLRIDNQVGGYNISNKSINFDSNGGGAYEIVGGHNHIWSGSNTVTTNGGSENTISGSSINTNSGGAAGTTTFNVADGTDASDLTVSSVISNQGGVLKTGAGTLRFSSDMTYTGGTTVNGGELQLDSGDGTLQSGTTLTIDGDSSVVRLGPTVFGNNIFGSGALFIQNGGTMIDDTPGGAVHSINNGLTFTNGGSLTSTGVGNGTYGNYYFGGGSGINVTGNAAATISADSISITNGRTITVADVTGDANADLTISSVIRNSNSATVVNKYGAGTLALTTQNTHTGGTTVFDGTLDLVGQNILFGNGSNNNSALTVDGSSSLVKLSATGINAMNTIGPLTLKNGGTFTDNGPAGGLHSVYAPVVFDGGGTMTSEVAGNGGFGNFLFISGITVASSPTSDLATISADRISFNFSQTINVADSVAGSGTDLLISSSIRNERVGNITKNGGGTLELTATDSTDTSGWIVNAGTLRVNGALQTAADRAVTVNAGGTLAGSGTITAAIDLSGVISPGNSPGTLTQIGDQTWNDGGSYLWEINASADAGGTIGTDPGWDWLDITGALNLTNLSAGQFTIDIDSLNGAVAGNALGFESYIQLDGIADYSFVIASADSFVDDYFDASLFNLDYSGFSNAPGWEWGIIRTGNDLVLQAFAVPEPSSSALLGLGGLALMLRRKRS